MIHKKITQAIALIASFFYFHIRANADLIIFSFDRPLQLYALLESTQKHIYGLETIQVIYRASSSAFSQAYDEVKERFPAITYHQQGNTPHSDFKPLTIESIEKAPNNYILFAVDDIIVTQPINIKKCVIWLEKTNAYGFYLRLGSNIDRCFMLFDKSTPPPPLEQIDSNIYQFYFNISQGDWAYPNTVDMTIYHKKDILPLFKILNFHNPNTLESAWSCIADLNRKGLCFHRSVMVNTPLNIVNESWNNRAENTYTPQSLLSLFNEGLRMNIDHLATITNVAPHMAYTPLFRTQSE